MSENLSEQVTGVLRNIWGERSVPLHEPLLGPQEVELVTRAIQSTFVSSVGEFVDEFEAKLGEFVGTPNVIPLVNGTSALHLGLLALGVGEGDEVLMPPVSFIATGNAVRYCGAHPNFVDIEKETLGLCPEKLKEFLGTSSIRSANGSLTNKETGRRLAAIMPVHVFGHVCKMREIVEIATEHGLPVLEDAAEALGSTRYGSYAGTFGDAGVFSFNGNKLITTGGGGALVTRSKRIADKVRHLSTTAKTPDPWRYRHDMLGFNYRMPNLNAALGVAQLKRLDYLLQKKRKLASDYHNGFSALDKFEVLSEPGDGTSNYWLNTLILHASHRQEVEEILNSTNEAGFYCRPCWQLLHEAPQFFGAHKGTFEVASDLSSRIISLPSGIYE